MCGDRGVFEIVLLVAVLEQAIIWGVGYRERHFGGMCGVSWGCDVLGGVAGNLQNASRAYILARRRKSKHLRWQKSQKQGSADDKVL
jgi:hypothetical protein